MGRKRVIGVHAVGSIHFPAPYKHDDGSHAQLTFQQRGSLFMTLHGQALPRAVIAQPRSDPITIHRETKEWKGDGCWISELLKQKLKPVPRWGCEVEIHHNVLKISHVDDALGRDQTCKHFDHSIFI
jgi:hypothetical protein